MSEKLTRPQDQKKSSVRLILVILRVVFGSIGRILATVIMVGIITGCIVGCVLTVYILQYIGADDKISLEYLQLGYTSIMYATDENGQTYELQRLYSPDGNRIWVSYDKIAQSTKDAIIAIEDKRFEEHEGVDWKRTAGAFVNLFLPIYNTSAGGSTITQQLVKNISGDDDFRVDRKVREIFRALNLAQRYTRDQILEAYLNVVPFGSGTNGIQSAANVYFGKDAKDLTLAESAAIVGITQKPTAYNPFINPDRNKERQVHVLDEMLDQGRITQQEYDKAVKEKLNFKSEEHEQSIANTQSYFVDHAMNEVIADLMEKKGWTETYATEQLYKGGYRIYVTMDSKIQKHLEEVYKNTDLFPKVNNEVYPQSACVITDTNGKILGMVGGIGKKEGARVFNRATMSTRQPGSAIKPLGPYALAFEYNQVTWSTIIDDHAINIANPGEPERWWPRNYYGTYLGNVTVDRAIQKSINTVPAKLVQYLTPRAVFDFLHDKLNFYSLVERQVIGGQVYSDIAASPMTLGSLTNGVTPLEMAGGYQIYANGGYFTKPYAYTEVRDSNDRVVLKADTIPRKVLSEDTAVVMNKLLQRVTGGPEGTGTRAKLANMPTAGKTGTSDDDVNQWFMGITPYYVCQVWLGYDEEIITTVNASTGKKQTKPNSIGYAGLTYPPPVLWKTIMEPLQEGLEYKQFIESDQVISKQYCLISGDLATASCTSTATGWYKKGFVPGNCSGQHNLPGVEDGAEDGDASQSSSSSASSSSSEESQSPLIVRD